MMTFPFWMQLHCIQLAVQLLANHEIVEAS
jgi:hypothetical protein